MPSVKGLSIDSRIEAHILIHLAEPLVRSYTSLEDF